MAVVSGRDTYATRVRDERCLAGLCGIWWCMDDRPKPPPSISSASATTPPVVHELSAAPGYTLGALDFAKPTLTSPVTPLQAQGYTLAPLTFSAPGWGIGIGCPRVSVDLGGRPPDISADAKERMIAALVIRLTQMQTERPSRTLYRNSKVVMDCVEELARKEKITVSNRTLREQIVNPAFERWKNPEQ